MSENEGRQSPPPEQQSGKQQQDPPSNAKGINPNSHAQDESKSELDALSSNPKGPLDDHVAATTKKTMKNVAGEINK